jgi:hypothetical protein
VDRGRRLSTGFVCTLTEHTDIEPVEISDLSKEMCPGGVSFHGEAHLLQNYNTANVTDANTEIIFEWVRRAKYSNRPSRYQCLYAATDIPSAHEFMRITGSPPSPIFEVDGRNAFRADMRLLDARMTALVKSHFANLYWQGLPHPVDPPFWEWLVPCPVVVGRQVG